MASSTAEPGKRVSQRRAGNCFALPTGDASSAADTGEESMEQQGLIRKQKTAPWRGKRTLARAVHQCLVSPRLWGTCCSTPGCIRGLDSGYSPFHVEVRFSGSRSRRLWPSMPRSLQKLDGGSRPICLSQALSHVVAASAGEGFKKC